MYKTTLVVNVFKGNHYQMYEYETELDFVPSIGIEISIGVYRFKVKSAIYALERKSLTVIFEDWVADDDERFERYQNILRRLGFENTGGGGRHR